MPVPHLSAHMQGAAETLAGQIEGGAFEALRPDQRTELRGLSLALSAWSDRVATMEAAASPPPLIRRAIVGRTPIVWGIMVWSWACDAAAVAALYLVLSR